MTLFFIYPTSPSLTPSRTLLSFTTQFHATLSKIGGSFCLLTAGHLPLRNLLHPELHRNGIPLQQYFYRYFDIFTEFSRALPSVTASTIEDVCDSILTAPRTCPLKGDALPSPHTTYLCMVMHTYVYARMCSFCKSTYLSQAGSLSTVSPQIVSPCPR